MKRGERRSFDQVFGICQSRVHAIITFLALLELLNLQRIRITVGEGINNFWLEPAEEEQEMAIDQPTDKAASEEEE